MSGDSIKRIYDGFASQIEKACSESRGAELLDEFIARLAVDMASTVFLKMDAEVSKVAPETADGLWAWVEDFPERCGLELLDAVHSTMSAYHASAAQIEAAQQVAATAYQQHLEELFEGAQSGGSA